jgi:glycosyltransferase involved in cell wall biosynthesis
VTAMHRTESRPSRGRICIVGPTHLANTPRIVKEADALHDAGFAVRVVFSQGEGSLKCAHDDELLRSRAWRALPVRWSRADDLLRWGLTGVRQHACRRLPWQSWRYTRVAERAEGRAFPELAAAAAREPAELYIGHYAEGLAAAAVAAKHHRVPYGFDAEDFHTGEGNPARQTARVDFIQQRYLAGSTHLTAASTGIAEHLATRYSLATPVAVHNAFPWAERATLDGRTLDRRGPELSLYWYSQTIGLDRGIQDAIRATALLGGPVQIHLRGTVSDAVRESLYTLATQCGVGERLIFHPRVPPTELLSRAAEHDVGLALEQGETVNRTICASNKMFFYLLAGLAVAATDVPGQRSVLAPLALAAQLYRPGDYQALAAHLERWRANRDRLRSAKAAALEAARATWNWEFESAKLVSAVEQVIPVQSAAVAVAALVTR